MTWPDIGVCQFQIREALVVWFSLPVQPGLGILYIPLYNKPRVMLAFSLGPFPPCNYHHTIHHAQNNIFRPWREKATSRIGEFLLKQVGRLRASSLSQELKMMMRAMVMMMMIMVMMPVASGHAPSRKNWNLMMR